MNNKVKKIKCRLEEAEQYIEAYNKVGSHLTGVKEEGSFSQCIEQSIGLYISKQKALLKQIKLKEAESFVQEMKGILKQIVEDRGSPAHTFLKKDFADCVTKNEGQFLQILRRSEEALDIDKCIQDAIVRTKKSISEFFEDEKTECEEKSSKIYLASEVINNAERLMNLMEGS